MELKSGHFCVILVYIYWECSLVMCYFRCQLKLWWLRMMRFSQYTLGTMRQLSVQQTVQTMKLR